VEKERRRETDGGGAPSVDAGMEPSPPSHTIFFHFGPNPLLKQYVPYLRFLLLPSFLLLQTCFSFSSSLAFLLHRLLIFLLLLDLFTPGQRLQRVRQRSDVVCLDVVPLLCSRRCLDNFVDVICDLTNHSMQQEQSEKNRKINIAF